MEATTTTLVVSGKKRKLNDCTQYHQPKYDLLSPEYEYLDPNPDIHKLFLEFDNMFFDGKLASCEVKWSSRMTLCAGLCSYQRLTGFCSIRLSEPLLKLRPRSDLVNTLLHEMIHAFIFLSSEIRDHNDHGPFFQLHMRRINVLGGTQITIYHTFHDEVDSYRQHWWKCNGSCQTMPPYFGIVKRAMNRAPGPRDPWWKEHEEKCGGVYTKIKEPDSYQKKNNKKKSTEIEKKEKNKGKKPLTTVKDFFSCMQDKKVKEMLPTNPTEQKSFPCSTTQNLDYKKTTKSNPPLVLLDLTNEETTSIELKNTRASGSTRPICIEISDDESD